MAKDFGLSKKIFELDTIINKNLKSKKGKNFFSFTLEIKIAFRSCSFNLLEQNIYI